MRRAFDSGVRAVGHLGGETASPASLCMSTSPVAQGSPRSPKQHNITSSSSNLSSPKDVNLEKAGTSIVHGTRSPTSPVKPGETTSPLKSTSISSPPTVPTVVTSPKNAPVAITTRHMSSSASSTGSISGQPPPPPQTRTRSHSRDYAPPTPPYQRHTHHAAPPVRHPPSHHHQHTSVAPPPHKPTTTVYGPPPPVLDLYGLSPEQSVTDSGSYYPPPSWERLGPEAGPYPVPQYVVYSSREGETTRPAPYPSVPPPTAPPASRYGVPYQAAGTLGYDVVQSTGYARPGDERYPPTCSPGAPIQSMDNGQVITCGPEGCNLFVFHIPNDMTNLDLYNLFVQFGPVVSVRIMVEPSSGRSRGFGFVSFADRESAERGIQHMDGFQCGHKRLKVQHKRLRSGSLTSFTDSLSSITTTAISEPRRIPGPPPYTVGPDPTTRSPRVPPHAPPHHHPYHRTPYMGTPPPVPTSIPAPVPTTNATTPATVVGWRGPIPTYGYRGGASPAYPAYQQQERAYHQVPAPTYHQYREYRGEYRAPPPPTITTRGDDWSSGRSGGRPFAYPRYERQPHPAQHHHHHHHHHPHHHPQASYSSEGVYEEEGDWEGEEVVYGDDDEMVEEEEVGKEDEDHHGEDKGEVEQREGEEETTEVVKKMATTGGRPRQVGKRTDVIKDLKTERRDSHNVSEQLGRLKLEDDHGVEKDTTSASVEKGSTTTTTIITPTSPIKGEATVVVTEAGSTGN